METKFRFTKKNIEQIPAPEKRCRIMDTGTPGLVLDLYPTGTRTYRVYKKIKGQKSPVSVTLGKYDSLSIEQARKLAIEAIHTISAGSNPNKEARASIKSQVSLSDVYADYLKSRQLTPSTVRGYQIVIDTYLGAYREKPLITIDEDTVKKEHARISKASPAQADLVMRFLRALFNFAKYEYRGIDNTCIFTNNPVQILSHLRQWNKVDRRNTRLTKSQLPAWFNALESIRTTGDLFSASVCDMAEVALLTGLRRSELLGLKWPQINLRERTFFISKTKNGDPLELPITDRCLEIFNRRYALKDHHGFVFNADNNHGVIREPKKVFIKIREQSGIEFTLHDLRRTFTTTAESINIGPYMIKRLLNHKSRRDDVTAGYVILTPEELRDPAQEIENKILDLADINDSETGKPKATASDIELLNILSTLTEDQKKDLIVSIRGNN